MMAAGGGSAVSRRARMQGSGPRAGQQGDLPDELWRYKEFPQVREGAVTA